MTKNIFIMGKVPVVNIKLRQKMTTLTVTNQKISKEKKGKQKQKNINKMRTITR